MANKTNSCSFYFVGIHVVYQMCNNEDCGLLTYFGNLVILVNEQT